MTEAQKANGKTQAATPGEKAAQRLKDLKRGAMRLAVYIRELGEEPIRLRGKAYREWERELQRQYQRLRESLGREAGQAARVRGRAVIRREGLSSAVADLLPASEGTERKKAGGSKPHLSKPPAQATAGLEPMSTPAEPVRPSQDPNPLVCKRKYRHPNFLSAMLHARKLGSPGLDVYPCDRCGGLHVGHDPESDHTQRARVVKKRLRSIEKQLAGLNTQLAQLEHERRALLAEQGAGPESFSRLRLYLRRVEAWIRKFEEEQRAP